MALGILILAGAFATWRGTPAAVVIPAAAVVLGVALVVAAAVGARRALRDASDRIDTILREELEPDPQSDRELATFVPYPARPVAPVDEDAGDRSPPARAEALSRPPGACR